MQGVETMCPDTEAHTVEVSVKRTSSGREKAVRNSSLLLTRIVLVSSQLYSKDGRLRELAQLTIIMQKYHHFFYYFCFIALCNATIMAITACIETVLYAAVLGLALTD